MSDSSSVKHLVRITNCLQTILDLESQLEQLENGHSLLDEFAVLKSFLEKIDEVELSESDVERIETATSNFPQGVAGAAVAPQVPDEGGAQAAVTMRGRLIFVVLLVCINLFLLTRLIWSDQGVFAYLELKNRYEVLRKKIETVDARSLDLSQEIRKLKSDKAYQEKVIREKMNFVKKDELLYIFPDEKDQPRGDAAHVQEN